VNDAPVVSAFTYVAFEDMSASENIGEFDFDIENETISYQLISSPAHGIAILNEDGVLEYTPNANYNGTDSISYQVCDASGACTLSELEILVLSVNDNPIAQPDFITIQEDESAIGIIEDLVTDADNESLFFGTMISPSNGMLVIQNNGNYTYTPNGNFSGTDQFTYLVCDGTGICDTATIHVTVVSVNDAPTAVNDSLTINEEETIELNLAANDFEIENQQMSYELVGSSSLGSITLSTQGTLYFEANENAYGTESLTIHVCDSEGLCSESEVLITINPINDLPTISLEAFSLEEDSQISIDLANYVSDIEGSALNFALIGNAENGMIEFSQTGIVSYIPNENYFGNDTIAFTVCDTENGCTEGIIEFNITSVNDEPESDRKSVV
jgi:VCBS repeat-containing protein